VKELPHDVLKENVMQVALTKQFLTSQLSELETMKGSLAEVKKEDMKY
jgi:hypothetical protein